MGKFVKDLIIDPAGKKSWQNDLSIFMAKRKKGQCFNLDTGEKVPDRPHSACF
jgi:hypothetical protein